MPISKAVRKTSTGGRAGSTAKQKGGSLSTMYQGYADARPENKDRNQSAK